MAGLYYVTPKVDSLLLTRRYAAVGETGRGIVRRQRTSPRILLLSLCFDAGPRLAGGRPRGVVDLLSWKACVFEGTKGEDIKNGTAPANLADLVEERAGPQPGRGVCRGQDRKERRTIHFRSVSTQVPVQLEDDHAGVVDPIPWKAYAFEGAKGEEVVDGTAPADLTNIAEERARPQPGRGAC